MKDYKKYFYMAELLALVDLSLVSLSSNKCPVAMLQLKQGTVADGCVSFIHTDGQDGRAVQPLGGQRHESWH